MKSVPFKLLMVLLLIGMVVGCETERVIFNGPFFVRFTETTLQAKESRLQPIEVEIHNGGPAVDHDVNIAYSISGSAREGFDYVILGTRGVVTIEKGDYFGTINIQLINNSNNILRQQDLVLQLETVDYEGLQLGQGVSRIGKAATFTIFDDCILGGTYYGRRDATSVPTEGVTISSTDCETYLLSNWDIEIFNFASVRDLTFTDNGDNTLTIPAQEESTLPDAFATINGFGIVDPATRIITMTVRLVDIEDQPQFTFQLIPD